MSQKIKNIIFDFGNVFIPWDPRRVYRDMVAPEDMEHFMREIWRDEWNNNLDFGITLADNARAMCEKYPEHAKYIMRYHERVPESLGDATPDSVALLADVQRTGLRTYGLSNWSAETFPPIRAKNPFFETFDGIVISSEVGVCKPDPAIYNILLQRYSLLPEECLFIDDRLDNIEAAAKLGIATIQFHSPAQVRRELEARGIL